MCGPSELLDMSEAEKRAVMAAFSQMLRVVPLSLAVAEANPCAEAVASTLPEPSKC